MVVKSDIYKYRRMYFRRQLLAKFKCYLLATFMCRKWKNRVKIHRFTNIENGNKFFHSKTVFKATSLWLSQCSTLESSHVQAQAFAVQVPSNRWHWSHRSTPSTCPNGCCSRTLCQCRICKQTKIKDWDFNEVLNRFEWNGFCSRRNCDPSGWG